MKHGEHSQGNVTVRAKCLTPTCYCAPYCTCLNPEAINLLHNHRGSVLHCMQVVSPLPVISRKDSVGALFSCTEHCVVSNAAAKSMVLCRKGSCSDLVNADDSSGSMMQKQVSMACHHQSLYNTGSQIGNG